MDESNRSASQADTQDRYESPRFEVISLDCEISSYAPDGDDQPLF